jgi:hypothetical protein
MVRTRPSGLKAKFDCRSWSVPKVYVQEFEPRRRHSFSSHFRSFFHRWIATKDRPSVQLHRSLPCPVFQVCPVSHIVFQMSPAVSWCRPVIECPTQLVNNNISSWWWCQLEGVRVCKFGSVSLQIQSACSDSTVQSVRGVILLLLPTTTTYTTSSKLCTVMLVLTKELIGFLVLPYPHCPTSVP